MNKDRAWIPTNNGTLSKELVAESSIIIFLWFYTTLQKTSISLQGLDTNDSLQVEINISK